MPSETTATGEEPFRTDDSGGERRVDPELAVEVLTDETALEVLRAAGTPTTAADLAAECDLGLSTAYRKVDTLEDAGLLRRTNPYTPRGSPPARYERAVDEVCVTLGDEIRVVAAPGREAAPSCRR